MRSKVNIRLFVYDEPINAEVYPEDEPFYRRAAKLISERLANYMQIYAKTKDRHTIDLMFMMELAVLYEQMCEQNNLAPYQDILSRLTEKIEKALGEE